MPLQQSMEQYSSQLRAFIADMFYPNRDSVVETQRIFRKQCNSMFLVTGTFLAANHTVMGRKF
jgi:hypothetical protein